MRKPVGRHLGSGHGHRPTRALADRLFESELRTLELYTIYLGERLGLYRALVGGGPATSAELAARTGTDERYIRAWLEHHAASGLFAVADPRAEPLARRYSLPAEHVPVLSDPDDIRYAAYRSVDMVRHSRALPALVEAFRTGTRRRPCRGNPRAGRNSTVRCSSTSWERTGCRRFPTSTVV